MIHVKAITAEFETCTEIVKGLSVQCIPNKGERPADVILQLGESAWTESAFVELRFDQDSKQLLPSFDVVHWNDAVLIVAGLRKWLVLYGAEPLLRATVALHRLPGDDTGFYRVQWVEAEALLIGIYESGAVAIDRGAAVRWHAKKAWDDEFLRCENHRIEFLQEDGGRLSLDVATGQVV